MVFINPVSAQDPLPTVNKSILDYVKSVMGKQVGRGECWDLADQALHYAHAKFDKSSEKTLYIFGRSYKPETEKIMPGDIIQFYNVEIRYQEGNMILTEKLAHHTAIVFKVENDLDITLAHQNTSYTGRKVGISKINLNNIRKGKLYFYRPIPLG